MNENISYTKGEFNSNLSLRVIACKKHGVYYRGCRRPESDFDETCTSGAAGPKTKSGDPLLAHPARTAGPGAAKTAIFGISKNPFFGQIVLISNCTDVVAMGVW